MRSGRNSFLARSFFHLSLDDWDMRSGRNSAASIRCGRNVDYRGLHKSNSLDDWDMRSGRNAVIEALDLEISLDDWDIRSGRNRMLSMSLVLRV